jgi:hypothetical protein
MGLKLNESHQLLAYADHMNLLGGRKDTINKNTETSHTSKEVGLETKLEKTKSMFLSYHQNADQDHDINIANIFFLASLQSTLQIEQ